MSLSLVQSVGPWEQVGNYGPDPYYATGSSTYTSGSISLSANSLVVLRILVGGASNCKVTGITNTGTSLTWTKLTSHEPANAGEVSTSIWYAKNTSSQSITYTVTWTEGTETYTGYCRGYMQEWTGHDTTTPLKGGASGTGGTKPWTAPSLSCAAGDYPLGCFSDDSGNQTLSVSGITSEASNTTHDALWYGQSSPTAGSVAAVFNTTIGTYQFRYSQAVIAVASTTYTATATPSVTATLASAATRTQYGAAAPSVTATAASTGYLSRTVAATPSVTATCEASATVGLTLPAQAAPSVTATLSSAADRTATIGATPSATATVSASMSLAGYVEMTATPSVTATLNAEASTYTPGDVEADAAPHADATVASTAYLERICAATSTVTATCTVSMVNGVITTPGFLKSTVSPAAVLEGV